MGLGLGLVIKVADLAPLGSGVTDGATNPLACQLGPSPSTDFEERLVASATYLQKEASAVNRRARRKEAHLKPTSSPRS